jgi:hypothetical protein
MVMTLIRGFMSITEDITVILTVSACLWRTRPIATRRALRSYLINGLPQSHTLRATIGQHWATRWTSRSNESMDNTRVFRMAFASVYPHYITKAEKKGRTKEEVHAIIHWLTGYDEQTLQQQIDKKVDFETFFARAPRINPNVSKITGVICGYRVEEIEDKVMQQIRYLDKLVDELAKGKAMDKILRK